MKDKIERVLYGMQKDSERRSRKLGNRIHRGTVEYASITQPAQITATVVATSRSGCTVLKDKALYEVPLSLMNTAIEIAVGDRVVFDISESGPRITNVLARRSVLGRSDPHIPEKIRVMAANIDAVVIVIPVSTTAARLRTADRLLIAAQAGGAQAVVVLTKMDLLSQDSAVLLNELLEPYRKNGITCLLTSSVAGDGLVELRNLLQNKLSVLVGHSGVGKSSLINSLQPEFCAEVGEVRESDGRGRHTTTSSRAYQLDETTLLIDTPGIRQIGLAGVSLRDLKRYFWEFIGYDTVCKYANCSHTHEPGCGVKAAVENRQIAPHRYQSYAKLVAELSQKSE